MHVAVVNGWPETLAALNEAITRGEPLILATPQGASAYLGPQFFLEILRLADRERPGIVDHGVYDCGSRNGDVLAALRTGIRTIRVDREIDTPGLRSIAAAHGATLLCRHINH